MEYVKFDNKELNEFFCEKLGKQEFTYEEIIKILTSDEIRTEEKMSSFWYDLDLKEYELGKRTEKPQKEDYMESVSYNVGEENSNKFDEILKKICAGNKGKLSTNDISILAKMREQIGKDENDLYKISFRYTIEDLGIKVNFNYDVINLEINDFSKVSEKDLLKLKNSLKTESIDIKSFYGLTQEKLMAMGEQKYRISGDSGGEYSLDEIKQLLSLMEKIKTQTEQMQDIDKFLTVYKSIGTYVDYDRSGCIGSEEYIKGKENETRSLRGVLLNGKAVCVGYALALQYVCDFVGIETERHNGEILDENEDILGDHSWNQVKIDGKWYNTDLTWDYKHIRKGENLNYCLKRDEEFYKNRKEKENRHICSENYNQEEITKRLENLPYTDLSKNSFDATKNTKFQEQEMKSLLFTAIEQNPNFSKKIFEQLKREKKQEKGDYR